MVCLHLSWLGEPVKNLSFHFKRLIPSLCTYNKKVTWTKTVKNQMTSFKKNPMFTIASLSNNWPISGKKKKLEFQILTVLCRTENERKHCSLQTEQSVIRESGGSTRKDKQDVLEHHWSSLFTRGCLKSR